MIKLQISLPELLAGLAEECCELGQASLKLRRVFDKSNPTPTPEDVAIENFEEEIADVLLYLEQIDYSHVEVARIMNVKRKRWESRLEERG